MTSYEHKVKNIYLGGPWWSPGENTIAYYPFKEDFDDKVWSRTLTTSWCTISQWVLNIDYDSSYIQLSQWIAGSTLTINVRYYYWANSSSRQWNRNCLFSYDTEEEHACFPANTDQWHTIWNVWYYHNRSFTNWDTTLTLQNRYNIVITKNWTNEKIYINGVCALDSNSSFNNNSYPVNFIWSCATNKPEAAQWKLSEVIFESKERTAQEVTDYFNQTKSNYWL